jgi:predicted amidohydrolase YtcJ
LGNLLLSGCRVFDWDKMIPEPTSLLVTGPRIEEIGPSSIPAGTRVIDLEGRWIVPGFIDAHVHLMDYADRLAEIDLDGASSLEEALERVRRHMSIAAPPPGTWVNGGGWRANDWAEAPSRQALDAVAPENPVLLTSKDEHAAWANSLAIKLAGIDESTVLPFGAVAERTTGGSLTGIFKESALPILKDAVPPTGPEEIDARIRQAFAALHSLGVTGLGDVSGLGTYDALERLKGRGQMTLRVFKFIPVQSLPEALARGMAMGQGDSLLRVGGVKTFLDGSLTSRTALLLDPYEGSREYSGVEVLTKEDLRDQVRQCVENGFAAAIHAIGDRAIRNTLDVLEGFTEVSREKGLRHRIEHVQLLAPQDTGRLGSLGVIASVQPSHVLSDMHLADQHWGARARYAYAFRSLKASGAVLAFGSDAPVEIPDPLVGMWAAVTRGEPSWYPEECLSVGESLEAYTKGAAFSCYWEKEVGSLRPGMLADIVALSGNPFGMEGLRQARVDHTIVNGEVVFQRD